MKNLQRYILKAEELFLKKNYREALDVLQEVLAKEPENPEALNDIALVYAEMGNLEKAVECIELALKNNPSFEKAFFNLLDILINHGHLDLAAEVYLKYQAYINNSLEKEQYEKYLSYVIYKILKIRLKTGGILDLGNPKSDDQAVKLAFVCGANNSFILDLEIAISSKYHVKVFHFPDKVDLRLIQDALDWADVVWFEWADPILLQASNNLRKSAAVICRIHRYEVFSPWFNKINWSFIDHIIVTSKFIRDKLEEKIDEQKNIVKPKISIIPSLIDLNKFEFVNKSKGFNIAYLGFLNYRKNPSLLIQAFRALIDKDSRYKLYIGGIDQEDEVKLYLENIIKKLGLEDHITWCGWIENVSDWFKDKHFLILPSVSEGDPYCAIEAAACGVKPLIHNFPGSEDLYPRSWLFNTIDEFVQKVTEDQYNSIEYREYVERRYSLDLGILNIVEIIEEEYKKWNNLKSQFVVKRNKGKSLCIVTSDFAGIVKNGDIGTAYAEIARLFTRNGWQVTVLYTALKVDNSVLRFIDNYNSENIKVLPLSMMIDENSSFKIHPPLRALSFEIYKWLKSNQDSFDIIHFHEWCGLGFYSILAKKQGLAFEKCKIIVGVHSPHIWTISYNLRFPHPLDVEIDYMERESVKNADQVWFVNSYMKDWIEKQWNINVNNFVILPYIISNDLISYRKVYKNERIKKILFFGRLELRKGLDIFCDALDKLNNDEIRKDIEEVIFLGKIDPSLDSEKYIRKRSKNWPWKVTILPDKDRSEALKFLTSQNNDVVIIPSRMDNSPLVVYECLALKKKFLASNVGGIPEIIHPEDRSFCLFEPNPLALANSLRNILINNMPLPRPAIDQKDNEKKYIQWHESILFSVKQSFKTYISKNKPLVTVCITHYNRPNFLVEALDSLLNQSYNKFEVVLVDDGSSSPEAVAFLDEIESLFKLKNWKIIRQENKYLGSARNCAAKYALGEYIMFMDDDNIAKHDEIEIFVSSILNSEADILTCVCDHFANYEDILQNRPLARYIPLGNCYQIGFLENVFGDANMFIRAEVFRKLGGFNEKREFAYQDWEFLIRASFSGYKIMVVPESLFWYRIHDNNMLKNNDKYLDLIEVINHYMKKCDQDIYRKMLMMMQNFKRPVQIKSFWFQD